MLSVTSKSKLPEPLVPGQPITALAPMQDVTTLPFMRIVNGYGPPDYFFTEYFRVHEHSTLEPHILASITENPSGRPVFAQLIGEDLFHLERTVKLFEEHPVAGIDLNLGCPAPKVYKKNVGGGLLRDPEKMDAILATLRAACGKGLFTVKMRVGFEGWEDYPVFLESINRHRVDLLSVHGRTVKEMYRSEPHYDLIKLAVDSVACPVLANGNISSVTKGQQVLDATAAAGLMVGRSAIRNPWIFRQLREHFSGEPIYRPTLGDVRGYIDQLWTETRREGRPDHLQVSYLKKFLNFVGEGVDPEGAFLHEMRRTRTAEAFFACCDHHLIEHDRAERPFADEPYEGLVARPNHETTRGQATCAAEFASD